MLQREPGFVWRNNVGWEYAEGVRGPRNQGEASGLLSWLCAPALPPPLTNAPLCKAGEGQPSMSGASQGQPGYSLDPAQVLGDLNGEA